MRPKTVFFLSSGIALALVFFGCGRRSVTPPTLAPSPPRTTSPPAVSEAEKEAAKAVVVDYIRALYAQKYTEAYNALSEDSKKLHSLEDFTQGAQGAQVVYDLKSAKVAKGEKDSIEVILPFFQEEESGGKSFSVIREKGEWKIVFLSGKPFFPYSD